MSVRIKAIQNGWIVNYDTYRDSPSVPYTLEVAGSQDQAFVWDTHGDKTATWESVLRFATAQVGPYMPTSRLIVSVREGARGDPA